MRSFYAPQIFRLLGLLIVFGAGVLGVKRPAGAFKKSKLCNNHCEAPNVCEERDGWWYCVADCGILAPPVNGNVTSSGTTSESIAEFSCNPGYILVGLAEIVCLSTGFWSSSPPVCNIVDCGSLDPPCGGAVVTTGTVFNDQATYTCNTGYNLTGSDVRTCLESGLWSGSAPTCDIVDCGPLAEPAGGSVDANPSTYNSVATYTCECAFNLVGNHTRTCQADGMWSGDAPTCWPIFCGGIAIGPFHKSAIAECLEPDCRLNYACIDGYELTGVSQLVCKSNGQWSAPFPDCVRIDCGPLQAPCDGSVSPQGTEFMDEATYECNIGFQLSGSNTTTCMADGTWSPGTPCCEPDIPL